MITNERYKKDLSVVIGFRDWGLKRIELSARSILRSFGSIQGELIISDFGSSNPDENRALAEKLGCEYVYTPDTGVWSRSRALNAGFAIATGRFLVSTDADMLFSPSAFSTIYEKATANPHAAFFLQCRDLPVGMDDRWVEENPEKWPTLEQQSRLRPRWGMGGMMAISRVGFEKIQGFDERLHTYGGEDLDFAQRARRAGYKTVWINDPNVRMYHMWHPPTAKEVDQTEAGRKAVEFNRSIVYNDYSYVRNYLHPIPSSHERAPLVSVAICTLNRSALLKEAIQSVLVQSVQDFEIIVVDDGGEDDTKDMLESFGDPRIKYFWQEQGGISSARNLAARESRGHYTAVLDDDDMMHPQRLERHIAGLEPGTVGNCGSFVNFNQETGELELIVSKKPTIENAMESGTAPGHSTWFLKTEVIRKLGYDESLTSGVDNNFMLRLLRTGALVTHVGAPVTLRRTHAGQITIRDNIHQLKNAGAALNFIQWRLNLGDIKNVINLAKENGEYPATQERNEMIEEVRLYLPDHLTSRDLVCIGRKASGSEIKWDGHASRTKVRLDGIDHDDKEFLFIKDASYEDMVRAKQHGFEFTGVQASDTAHSGSTLASSHPVNNSSISRTREIVPDHAAAEIAYVIPKAVEYAQQHVESDFYLVVEKNLPNDAEGTVWRINIVAADRIDSYSNPATWLIFGSEQWK